MTRGCFIVVEGLEGSGKSTCISTIRRVLESKGITDIVYTREPGGTSLAEKLRSILLDPGESITPGAELLMMYASRVQLVETVIKPAVERGAFVIGDRHDLSSVAYQGGGRCMDMNMIKNIKKSVLGDFKPDLTVLLDIDPLEGLSRVDSRGLGRDRFEQEKRDFFQRVRTAYLNEAAADSSIRVIDASRSLETVTSDVISAVESYLCSRG
jgi:dTMP kinase